MEKNENSPSGDVKPPTMNVLVQYVKDFSFESPNAPKILAQPPNQGPGPQINVQVNVNARQIELNNYEAELSIEVKATLGEEVMFLTEVLYAGIFRITGLTEEQLKPVILIECPRLLFPFARQIIGEATRNGGFPPLLIDPIDFVALYQRRMGEGNMGGNTVGTA